MKLFLAWLQIFAIFFVRNHQLHSQCKSYWSSNSKQAQIEPIRDCTSLKNNCSSKPNAVDVTIVNRHRPLFDILSSVQAPEAIPGSPRNATFLACFVIVLYFKMEKTNRARKERKAHRIVASSSRPGSASRDDARSSLDWKWKLEPQRFSPSSKFEDLLFRVFTHLQRCVGGWWKR